MHLLRIRIENFRNFQSTECQLGKHVVLLGENGAGKSNLLHAIRLVLDSGLPDSSRYLSEQDFWDGAPAFAGAEIVVALDVTDFDTTNEELACLQDFLVPGPPGWKAPVARLTYRFGPKSSVPEEERHDAGPEAYEFAIYGGDDPTAHVPHDVRRYLGFTLLPALRDAESDLRAWKRSPLRPLLEAVRQEVGVDDLNKLAANVDVATDALSELGPVVELQQRIRKRVSSLLGEQHTLAPTFGFSSTNPGLLLQGLRLFLDEPRRRQVSDTSLGLANVLYLSLLLLGTEHHVEAKRLATAVIGIEEPEAHLHPQMQRVVFRDLLQGNRAILVSTHSPNIASVAPIDSLVVLHASKTGSRLASVAGSQAFTDAQRKDLERYLDVTRAEVVFGRGIILVEGDAERYLVPAAARQRAKPIALDDFGVSVCSVAGTDFVPYAKLLEALGIPFAMITDGDVRDEGTTFPGLDRAMDVFEAINKPAQVEALKKAAAANAPEALSTLADSGIFIGTRTLEADLLAAGAGSRMADAFKALLPGVRSTTLNAFSATGMLSDEQADAALAQIERVGKGRFAQALAPLLRPSDIPAYISDAIDFIAGKCRRV